MPLDITGTHNVIFDGELLGLARPVFQIRAETVSVTRQSAGVYWTYNIENDSFVTVESAATGLAQAFIDATGILNHRVLSGVDVDSLAKANIDYKAEPIG